MPIFLRRCVLPVVISALLVSGQGIAAARSAERPTIVMTISSSHRLSMTSSTRPGLARLYVRGTEPAYLVKARHGGLSTFVKDWNAAGSAAFTRNFDTVAYTAGRSTIVTSLSRGTYFAADTDVRHITSSQVARFVVTGSTWNVAAPVSSPVTIAASQRLSSPATLYRHRFLHVVNASRSQQAIEYYRYRATDEQLKAFLAHPTLTRLHQISTGFATLVVLDPHRSLYTDVRPPSGKYLLVDLIDGPSSLGFGPGQVHPITVR